MDKNKNLTVTFHTTNATNEKIREVLCKTIANSIYESKEFQKFLNENEPKRRILTINNMNNPIRIKITNKVENRRFYFAY